MNMIAPYPWVVEMLLILLYINDKEKWNESYPTFDHLDFLSHSQLQNKTKL